MTIAGENTHEIIELPDPSDKSKTTKKLVLGVKEYTKQLVLNNTSRRSLEKAWGDDTSKWAGMRIVVNKTKQNVRGQLLDIAYVEPVRE